MDTKRYIRAGAKGQILLVSANPLPDTIEHTGPLPDDFLDTVGRDKYRFVGNQIVPSEQVPIQIGLVRVPISADPTDATIRRIAVSNLPQMLSASSFIMPVTVKHYQVETYLADRDWVKVFRATDERKLVIEGKEVGEFTHFNEMAKKVPLPTLIAHQIQYEDEQLHSFDRAF